MNQPQLSILLVNYKSGALLKQCLQSVAEQTADLIYEIIISDNSPEDGVVADLKNEFPDVVVVPMGYNAGFARANNAAMKAARASTFLLLNTDTVITGNAITQCYRRLQELPGFVAAGVQLQYADGTPQTSGNFNLTGGLNFLMTIPYVGQLLRAISLTAGVKKPSFRQAAASMVEVDWINGAYIMVKKKAVEAAGMLDSDFFLYHEEPEWCGRLQKQGKLCIFGDLHVTHLEGGSANAAFGSEKNNYSNLTDRKGRQLLLSMLLRIRKQFGAGWFLVHLLCHTLSLIIVLPAGLLHTLITMQQMPVQMAVGYARNLMFCWKYVPGILSNRPYFYKVL